MKRAAVDYVYLFRAYRDWNVVLVFAPSFLMTLSIGWMAQYFGIRRKLNDNERKAEEIHWAESISLAERGLRPLVEYMRSGASTVQLTRQLRNKRLVLWCVLLFDIGSSLCLPMAGPILLTYCAIITNVSMALSYMILPPSRCHSKNQ